MADSKVINNRLKQCICTRTKRKAKKLTCQSLAKKQAMRTGKLFQLNNVFHGKLGCRLNMCQVSGMLGPNTAPNYAVIDNLSQCFENCKCNILAAGNTFSVKHSVL